MKPINKPIGQLLRAKRPRPDYDEIAVKILSIEEQIAQLEQELNDDSDQEDIADSSSDSSPSDRDGNKEFDNADGLLVESDGVITSLRPEERIQPLPRALLPASSCKFSDKASKNKDYAKPKRFRIADALADASVASGLERTIAEQLRHYEPASWDKKAFYCRICKYQGNTVEELEAHKATESHVLAYELERKLSSCSLCKKEFTSPDQLQEHIKGRMHKEKLEKVRQYQGQSRRF